MTVNDRFPKGFYKLSRDEQAVIVREKLQGMDDLYSFFRKLSQKLARNKQITLVDMEGRPDLELMKDKNAEIDAAEPKDGALIIS